MTFIVASNSHWIPMEPLQYLTLQHYRNSTIFFVFNILFIFIYLLFFRNDAFIKINHLMKAPQFRTYFGAGVCFDSIPGCTACLYFDDFQLNDTYAHGCPTINISFNFSSFPPSFSSWDYGSCSSYDCSQNSLLNNNNNDLIIQR